MSDNESLSEEEEDLLGDLGDLDSDDGSEDDNGYGMMASNRPYRTKEPIVFVQVDKFTVMNDVPSSNVPNDNKHNHPHQYIQHNINPKISTISEQHNADSDYDDDEDGMGNFNINDHDNDNDKEHKVNKVQNEIVFTDNYGQIDLSDDDFDDDESYETDDSYYSDSENEHYSDYNHHNHSAMHVLQSSSHSNKSTLNLLQKGISLRNMLEKKVSKFTPKHFDICLLVSSPLTIKTKQNFKKIPFKSTKMSFASTNSNNTKSKLLEYIRSALPDRLELQQTVRQTLVRRSLSVRYASITSTYNALKKLSNFGGCKVLQFVGFCCNPARDQTQYPELCASLYPQQDDEDYVLLETEVGVDEDTLSCFGKGIWYKASEVYKHLNVDCTKIDCVVAMSPQHERMTKIFKELGYKYIIGIEAPNNEHPFSTTEQAAFLEQFYAAILDQRSVTRAYDLSLQGALSTRGSVRGGNDDDPKYILEINLLHRNERFIIFDDEQLKIGEIDDKSQHEKLPKTNLRETIRPFFGRSEYIITLLKKLMDTQIVNVTGKELIGKSSVVKTTTRYLLQMGFFRGGCFVIDCKLQSAKYAKSSPNKSFNECVYDVLKSCGVSFKSQFDDEENVENVPLMNASPISSQLSLPSVPTHIARRSSARFPKMDEFRQQIEQKDKPLISKRQFGDPKTSPRSLFEYLESSIYFDQKPPSHEPFCFVILNMDHWLHGAEKVSEWITKFSKELFKKEDSRIICTGAHSLDISAVSTLNMKNLAPFDSLQLATLFKHFCRGISSKFDPSLSDISSHKELQIIFDGRPGRAKKVSQYVRYLFATNDMKEDFDDNNNKSQISLDYIAAQFPKSKYAFNAKAKIPISKPQNFSIFKQGSVSLPENYTNLNDSSHHLMNESSTSASNLVDYNHYDPPVLIHPDDEIPSVNGSSKSSSGAPSPANMVTEQSIPYDRPNSPPMMLPVQQHSAPLSDTNSNHHPNSGYSMSYNGGKNRMGPYQFAMKNSKNMNDPANSSGNVSNMTISNEQILLELQYYDSSSNNSNKNAPGSARLFSQNHSNEHLPSRLPAFDHSHSLETMSLKSLTPIHSNSYGFNPRKSTPLSPTTSQNYKKSTNQSQQNKNKKFNQSIETLKANLQKNTSKHAKTGPSQEVTALFLPLNNHKSLPSTGLQTDFSIDSPRAPAQIKTTSSLTRIRVTDENKHVSQISVLTNNTDVSSVSPGNGSVIASPFDISSASHRMRVLNQSIDNNHRQSTLDTIQNQLLSHPIHQAMLSQPVSPMDMCSSPGSPGAIMNMHSNPVSPNKSPVNSNDITLSDLNLTPNSAYAQPKNLKSPTPKYRMMHTLDETDEIDDDDEESQYRSSNTYIPTTSITRFGSMPFSQRHSSVAQISERLSSTSSASFTPSVSNSDENIMESKISSDAKLKINDLHNQRISTLTSHKPVTGHSMQFSVLSEISVINEDKAITVCTPQNPDNQMLDEVVSIHQKHQNNASILLNHMSPRFSVTDEISNVSMDLTLNLTGAASAPLLLDQDRNSLKNNSMTYTKMTMTDDAIIGIKQYAARKIWIDACLPNNNNLARLQDLYPHLLKEFTRLTRCNERQPTLGQIELFFAKTGGAYDHNQLLPYIRADKFDKFFSWFRCMCQIIKDLRPMYNQKDQDPLIGLFYGRNTAQDYIEPKVEGTFLLRLVAASNGGLAITFKNHHGKVQHKVLTRVSNEMYLINASQKETKLFSLIRSWTKLQHLYTPNKLIPKKFVF